MEADCDVIEMNNRLEEFLMPASPAKSVGVRNSTDSLRDASMTSLDRSNNSSSTSTSWNSSCSCHSMSALGSSSKSAFVFHKLPILPPLLCSSSRTEMKVYKMKAVERESRRQQKQKARLISRVEAILANVEVSPMKKARPVQRQQQQTEEGCQSQRIKKPPLKRDSPVHLSQEDIDNATRSDGDHGVLNEASSGNIVTSHMEQTDCDVTNDTSECACHENEDDVADMKHDKKLSDNASTDSDESDSFHDRAYKSSLRNLLQKSMNLSKTDNSDKNQTTSSSDSDCDVTENTVIPVKIAENPDVVSDGSDETELIPNNREHSEETTNHDHVEERTLVENIVDAAIKDATEDILREKNLNNTESNHQNCDLTEQSLTEGDLVSPTIVSDGREATWSTPKITKTGEENEFSPFDLISSTEPHNQSTSTKIDATPDGSKNNDENADLKQQEVSVAPPSEIIELSGTYCFEATGLADESVNHTTIQPSCPVSMETTGDLTMLKPVMSDTVSGCMDPTDDDTKENCDPTIDTGSLVSVKRSVSFTVDRTSDVLESAVVEAVSQHFLKFQEEKDHKREELDAEREKKVKMHRARVRRGSYTIDEPSPFLVKNRESLTIEPQELEDDIQSASLADIQPEDVKRKLDLPSDSEESSISNSVKRKPPNFNVPSKAEMSVTNLCRILQDQHKQQMEAMKKRHQEQLEALQQELIHSNRMALPPLDYYGNQRLSDVSVSPSLSSTEYKEFRISDRKVAANAPEYSEHSPQHRDVTKDDVIDVSRVADLQITPSLHEKFCKFTALCKGHLTRQLLRSNKVEDIMQVIKETSSLILSMREELNENRGSDSLGDSYFEHRLRAQLQSAMFQVHEIFFDIPVGERMRIIAQSCLLERYSGKKAHKPQKLTNATQKSLERKRILSANSEVAQPPRPARLTSKEVKSKISHIWKSDPLKPAEKKSSLKLPSKSTIPNGKERKSPDDINKPHMTSKSQTMTSQSKSSVVSSKPKKSTLTSRNPNFQTSTSKQQKQKSPLKQQSSNVTSQSRKNNPANTRTGTSQKKIATSQPHNSKSSAAASKHSQLKTSPSTQAQRKNAPSRKPVPLANRGNTFQRS